MPDWYRWRGSPGAGEALDQREAESAIQMRRQAGAGRFGIGAQARGDVVQVAAQAVEHRGLVRVHPHAGVNDARTYNELYFRIVQACQTRPSGCLSGVLNMVDIPEVGVVWQHEFGTGGDHVPAYGRAIR